MPTGKVILIVEDNAAVADTVTRHLEREGYRCIHATDGEEALALVRQRPPDLILLDRMLPHVTGDEVAQRLRSDPRSRAIPIIMLTGKTDESDQLVGFALGADDYISKPFSPKVLLARISARLRQREVEEAEQEELPNASVKLDRSQPRVFVDTTAITLTSAEYRILAALMAAGGTILDDDQLGTMVYGKDRPKAARVVASDIGGLRRKMGPAAACIQIVGKGEYAFCPPQAPRPSA